MEEFCQENNITLKYEMNDVNWYNDAGAGWECKIFVNAGTKPVAKAKDEKQDVAMIFATLNLYLDISNNKVRTCDILLSGFIIWNDKGLSYLSSIECMGYRYNM